MNELTQQHRDNLATLRDFLMTNNVPFEMRYWRTQGSFYTNGNHFLNVTKDQLDEGIHECGTAGCAAGWSPFVIPPLHEEYTAEGSGVAKIRMGQYIQRVFGMDLEQEDPYFMCFFDSEWSYTDNSREGAAYRINRYLKDNVLLIVDEETSENIDSVEAEIKVWDIAEQLNRDKWIETYNK